MISKYTKNSVTWIDISSPSIEEVQSLKEEFLFSEKVISEILTPTLRAQTVVYEDYLFAVMHFPTLEGVKKGSRRAEVDFILGKHFVITIHYENIESMNGFGSILDRFLSQSPIALRNPGHLFALFAEELYKTSNKDLDKVDKTLDEIEKNIFDGKERRMVNVLSESIHKLIDYDHAIRFHDHVYEDIRKFGVEMYGETFKDDIDTLIDSLEALSERQRFLREAVDEFKSTNDTLLQHKTTDAMKTLTMMSFVIFPLALIAGIFGMNVKNMPIVDGQNSFWVILTIMLIVSITMFMFFKWKKWL